MAEIVKAELDKTEYTTETLIAEWTHKHSCENDEQYALYKCAGVPKDVFLPGGIINKAAYVAADRKVLFISKEAHCSDYKEGGHFWLQEVVDLKQRETMFSKRLAMLMNAINTGNYEKVEKNHTALKQAAFINLNKRGGKARCNWKTLEGYVAKYCKYIQKEIALINPDVIICCGSGLEWLMKNYIMTEKSKPVLFISHPSYWKLSDKEYLKQLKGAMQGVNIY